MLNSDIERKYKDMVVRFRQIQRRFEMSRTMEDRKVALEDMRKLSEESLALMHRSPKLISRA